MCGIDCTSPRATTVGFDLAIFWATYSMQTVSPVPLEVATVKIPWRGTWHPLHRKPRCSLVPWLPGLTQTPTLQTIGSNYHWSTHARQTYVLHKIVVVARHRVQLASMLHLGARHGSLCIFTVDPRAS